MEIVDGGEGNNKLPGRWSSVAKNVTAADSDEIRGKMPLNQTSGGLSLGPSCGGGFTVQVRSLGSSPGCKKHEAHSDGNFVAAAGGEMIDWKAERTQKSSQIAATGLEQTPTHDLA